MQETTFSELPELDQQLILKAEEGATHGINHASKIVVGAALLTSNGRVFVGSNIGRSRTSKQSRCSEEMVLDRAMFEGENSFQTIAIIAKNHEGGEDVVVTPCGSCRQVLLEASPSLRVILSSPNKSRVLVTDIQALLPLVYSNSKK